MYALLLLYFLHIANGQVFSLDQCLNKTIPVQSFQASRFAGTWYTIAKYRNMFDNNWRCVLATSEFVKEDGYLLSNYTGLNDNTWENITIKDYFVGNSEIGEFYTTCSRNEDYVTIHLKIVAIDYDNYCIFWGCMQEKGFSERFSWVLARKRQLPQEILDQVLNEYSKDNVSINDLVFVDQVNCDN